MYVKKLREVGVPEKQAEIQAEELRELIENNLATKTDLESLRERLYNKIKEIEYKLTIKIGAMLVVTVTLLAAIIKL
jgi:regulator of replication initiation timing